MVQEISLQFRFFYFAWLPSQKGRLPVFLQTQNQTVFDSGAVYWTGENSEPLCEPSQKGCDWLLPQAHHQ